MKIPSRSRSGFTLVEIMIVVVIVGLLATMAVQTFRVLRENTIATTTAKEFRTFRDSLEIYVLNEGDWPPTSDTGVMPAAMEGYMKQDKFENAPNTAGEWDWEFDTAGTPVAQLRIVNSEANENIIRKIDLILDDGDPTTGIFQGAEGADLQYILEE